MRIERLNFRDFEPEVPGAVIAHRKPNLPGGRRKEEAPPPPPAPTFTEEQLKAAERESYKKGFLEGTEEGQRQAHNEQADVNLKLTQTVEGFVKTVSPILEDYKSMILQMREDMPKVALAISRKISGGLLEENAQAIVSEVALACVQTMIGEPKLTIKVNNEVAEALERKLQELSGRLQTATHFVVVPDDKMALTDCRIEWKHGAMERHTGTLWQQVESVIENMSFSAKRATEQQIAVVEQQLIENKNN